MSEIIIKDEKTPTRCEICHKADAFIPHLNSCFRCDNIELNNDISGFDGQIANQQCQRLESLGDGDNTYNSFAAPLNRPANGLIFNNIIQFPSLVDRQPKTTVKKYRPFPKPKPKPQPSVVFRFVMCVGVLMAILFLISLFLTR